MKLYLRSSFLLLLHLVIIICAPPAASSSRTAELLHRSSRVKRSQTFSLQSSCTDPGTPLNAHRDVQPQPQTILGQDYFPVGSRIRFVCYSGYLLRGSALLACVYGGTKTPYWDAFIPQCVGEY